MKLSEILVPLNLEKHCFDGLNFAARRSRERYIHATLLYVVELNVVPLENRVYDELCIEYQERLRVLGQCFFEEQPRVCVRLGSVAEEILAEASESDPELIVMAVPETRRRWRLFRTGTVEKVVRDAHCATLVLSGAGRKDADEAQPWLSTGLLKAATQGRWRYDRVCQN